MEDIRNWNGLSNEEIYKGQQLVIAPPAFARSCRGFLYQVKSGETLTEIAARYKMSTIDISLANQLTAEGLRAGQQLIIPYIYRNKLELRESYSGDEWLTLAKIIYAEARGEPFVGQVAVGGVVINRVFHARFPSTIKGVIYQPGQFTPVSEGLDIQPDLSAFLAAKKALEGEDPSLGALYFANLNLAQPATREMFKKLTITTVIGRHTFAK